MHMETAVVVITTKIRGVSLEVAVQTPRPSDFMVYLQRNNNTKRGSETRVIVQLNFDAHLNLLPRVEGVATLLGCLLLKVGEPMTVFAASTYAS